MTTFEEKIAKIERIAIIVLVVLTLTGGILFGYIVAQVRNCEGIDDLKKFKPSVPTKLFDINGELITELFHEKRDLVSIEKLPKNLIRAFLVTEDFDFYKHPGINPFAIARAMLKNISVGKVVQGGSTITQQLAKRIFTTGERTYWRKALEATLAFQIERKFTKDEILEMYFNQIYLGHGCYGVSAAAKLFFNKPVEHLNIVECSVLAALPSAPGRFSPLYNTHNSHRRSREILNRIEREAYIPGKTIDRLYKKFWTEFIDSIRLEFPSKTVFSANIDRAPYFTDYVRQLLLARFGNDVVYNQGLEVYTTLDLKRQAAGRAALTRGLIRQSKFSQKVRLSGNEIDVKVGMSKRFFREYDRLRMIFNLPGYEIKTDIGTKFKKMMITEMQDTLDILTLISGGSKWDKSTTALRNISCSTQPTVMSVQGALLAVEPSNGYITTMVGGSDFSVENQFNRAIQARRQAGSSFKPFVYGAAVESKSVTPLTYFPDAPILNIDAKGRTWNPVNYDVEFSGMIPVYRALAASINIISIRIYDITGEDDIVDFASKMLKVPPVRFNPNPTLALGTAEVTPFEMATGFAIYANRGRDVIPYAIRYVIDRDGSELANIEEEIGNVIAAKELNGTIQVIPEAVAYVMTAMMQGVVDSGTGTEAIRYKEGFKHPCSGKTGTTQDHTDAWFCGYTSDVATVVWVGYDKPFMSLGGGQGGAIAAAPIWANYMKEIYKDMKGPVQPPRPDGVYSVGNVPMLSGTRPSGSYSDEKYQMKTVLDLYMEKEGLKIQN